MKFTLRPIHKLCTHTPKRVWLVKHTLWTLDMHTDCIACKQPQSFHIAARPFLRLEFPNKLAETIKVVACNYIRHLHILQNT